MLRGSSASRRPLDLARKNRFLADVHVQKQVGVREVAAPAIQTTKSEVRTCLGFAQLRTYRERRIWRKRRRDKRAVLSGAAGVLCDEAASALL